MDNFNYYVVTGCPGTGKTTVGNKIVSALGTELLEPELVREELNIKEYSNKDTPQIVDILHGRIRGLIESGRPAVYCRAYVSMETRAESYKLIRVISSELGLAIRSVLIKCTCTEAVAKQRIRDRRILNDVHSHPKDPNVWDRIKGYEVPLCDDEINHEPDFSFILYNSETNQVEEICVRTTHRKAVGILKGIIT
jgi:predicted kinase